MLVCQADLEGDENVRQLKARLQRDFQSIDLLISGGTHDDAPLQRNVGSRSIGVTPMGSVDDFRFSYSASDAKGLLFVLLGFEFLLVLGYILTHIIAPGPGWGPIPRFLDVDREVSVPTWFSSIQLFAVAVVLLMQAPWAKQLRIFLLLLGIGFLFLSMDEAAGVHDSIRRSAQRLQLRWFQGIHFLVWMVLYGCIGLVGLLTNYRSILFAWRNFRREVVWVAVGGAVFVAGGMGGEALSGYLWRIAVDERFLLAVAAEEFLEMAGVSIVLYGLMLLGIRIQSENIRR